MKRTKDGGAIINQNEKEIILTKEEFIKARRTRDIFRLVVIIIGTIIDILFVKGTSLLSLGLVALMLGWRLKVGW